MLTSSIVSNSSNVNIVNSSFINKKTQDSSMSTFQQDDVIMYEHSSHASVYDSDMSNSNTYSSLTVPYK